MLTTTKILTRTFGSIDDMETKMDIKQKTAYWTAIIAFVCGWGLTIAGFIVDPRGEVSGSVLAVLGEAMVYTASVLGITLYFSNEMLKFKRDTRKYLNDKDNETTAEN